MALEAKRRSIEPPRSDIRNLLDALLIAGLFARWYGLASVRASQRARVRNRKRHAQAEDDRIEDDQDRPLLPSAHAVGLRSDDSRQRRPPSHQTGRARASLERGAG